MAGKRPGEEETWTEKFYKALRNPAERVQKQMEEIDQFEQARMPKLKKPAAATIPSVPKPKK